jgi:nitrate/nitrite transporter NarK
MWSVLRSAASVLAGYLVFAGSAVLLFQLTGRDPHAPQDLAFTVLTVMYGILFAWLGGRLAARLSSSHPSRHAGLVAAMIALGATISLIASPGAGATWSQWSALLLMAPCAWAAGLGRREHLSGTAPGK